MKIRLKLSLSIHRDKRVVHIVNEDDDNGGDDVIVDSGVIERAPLGFMPNEFQFEHHRKDKDEEEEEEDIA